MPFSTSALLLAILLPSIVCLSSEPYRFADFVETTQTSLADVPPPCPAHADWLLADAILAQYWSSGDGFDGNEEKEYTYGEATNLGVRQLAHEMQISTAETDTVTFYDLGSGVGRLVVQIALDNEFVIGKAVGIELSEDRHDIAESALSRIKQSGSLSIDLSRIKFVHANALQCDFSDATHIFISSLCFPRSILESLQDIIIDIEGLAVVAALNRLDKLDAAGWEVSDANIQMTWGAGSAKIYKRPS